MLSFTLCWHSSVATGIYIFLFNYNDFFLLAVCRPSLFCSCVNLHNQQHVLVMCAVAFYMMENYPLDVGAEFMAGIIQVK